MPRPLLSSLLLHPQLGSQVLHLLPLSEAFEFRAVSAACQALMEHVLVEALVHERALSSEGNVLSDKATHRNDSSRVHFWLSENSEIVVVHSWEKKKLGEENKPIPTEASRSLHGMIERFLSLFEKGEGAKKKEESSNSADKNISSPLAKTSLGACIESYLRDNVFTKQLRQIGPKKWGSRNQFLELWTIFTGSQQEEQLSLALPAAVTRLPVCTHFILRVMLDCAKNGEMINLERWNMNDDLQGVMKCIPEGGDLQDRQDARTTVVEETIDLLTQIFQQQVNLKELVFPRWGIELTLPQVKVLLTSLPQTIEHLHPPGPVRDGLSKTVPESILLLKSLLTRGEGSSLKCASRLKSLDLSRLLVSDFNTDIWRIADKYNRHSCSSLSARRDVVTGEGIVDVGASLVGLEFIEEFIRVLNDACPCLEILHLPPSTDTRDERGDSAAVGSREVREIVLVDTVLASFPNLKWLNFSVSSPKALKNLVVGGIDRLSIATDGACEDNVSSPSSIHRERRSITTFSVLDSLNPIAAATAIEVIEAAPFPCGGSGTGESEEPLTFALEAFSYEHCFTLLRPIFTKLGSALKSICLGVRNFLEIEQVLQLCPVAEGIGLILEQESEDGSSFPSEKTARAFRFGPQLRDIDLYDKHEIGAFSREGGEYDHVPATPLSSLDDRFLWHLSQVAPNLIQLRLENNLKHCNFSLQMLGLCCRHGWRHSLRKVSVKVRHEKITSQELLWTLGDKLLEEDYLPVPTVCPKLLHFRTLPDTYQEDMVEKWHFYFAETLHQRNLTHFEDYERLSKYALNGTLYSRVGSRKDHLVWKSKRNLKSKK